jgi:DNA-binding XRE family transcriptional regulator
MLTDAHRLLLVVRRMSADAFVRVFRNGLSEQALMTVITSLPTDRLNELMDRARSAPPRPVKPPQPRDPAERLPAMAVVIRSARKEARMNQWELARAVGVRQSSVSQWERGVTQPSARNLVDLLRVLPGLAERLSNAYG